MLQVNLHKNIIMITSKDMFMEQRQYEQQEVTNEPVLSPVKKLALFQTTKDERILFISNLMDEIEAGKIDPLKVHVQFKCIEDILYQLTTLDEKKNKDAFMIAKKYRAALQEAAETYGQKKFGYMNSQIEIKETGVKYDYSKCEDLELVELLKQQEILDKKVKARQDLLKTVPEKGMIFTNEESGETYTIYPPAKSSTTSIAVSLK